MWDDKHPESSNQGSLRSDDGFRCPPTESRGWYLLRTHLNMLGPATECGALPLFTKLDTPISLNLPTSAAATMSKTQSLALPDGRALCYSIYGIAEPHTGADHIPTVFYFHSFPGSHHEAVAAHETAQGLGLRIITISRPGYGGSTNDPNRTILSFSDDVIALADHLHVDRFAVMGISGGGPYVLACVHSLPAARLAGAIVISGMYPADLGMSGMVLSNRVLFNVAPWAPWLVSYMFDTSMGTLARDRDNPERLRDAIAGGMKSLPEEDRLTAEADGGKVLDLLATSIREAFLDGPEGSACEAKLFGSPWGFDLGKLPVRKGELVIYHGAKDVNIPARMAVEAVAKIDGVELILEPEEAHISLYFRQMGDILKQAKQMLVNRTEAVNDRS